MKILALYTAGDPVSVALRTPAGEAALEVESRRAVEVLVPRAADLLREAGLTVTELDGVAAARGPGSFTGLRVGAAVALGLARGAGVPLFAVGTLEAWAAAAFAAPGTPRRCHVALDARRGEVYFGTFVARDSNGEQGPLSTPVPTDGPRAVPVAAVAARLEPGVPVVGDAREMLIGIDPDAGRAGFTRPPEALALWIARLVAARPWAAAVPLDELVLDYLRQPQAVARAAGRHEPEA